MRILAITLALAACGQKDPSQNSSDLQSDADTVRADGKTYQLVPFQTSGRLVKPIPMNDSRHPVVIQLVNDSADIGVVKATQTIKESFESSCRLAVASKVSIKAVLVLNSQLSSASPTAFVCRDAKPVEVLALPAVVSAKTAALDLPRYSDKREEFSKNAMLIKPVLDAVLAHVAETFAEGGHIFFINVFSHGGKYHTLAGLDAEQIGKKNAMPENQNIKPRRFSEHAALLRYGTGLNVRLDGMPLLPAAFLGEVRKYHPDLKLYRGSRQPHLDSDMPKLDSDMPKLDEAMAKLSGDEGFAKLDADMAKLGVGESIPKLGVDEGIFKMGAKSAYGMTADELVDAAIQFYANGKREIGYLFIEACSANFQANQRLIDRGMNSGLKVGGFYSPRGLLDVRNIDWDTLFVTYMGARKANPNISAAYTMQVLWHNALVATPNYKAKEVKE